MIPPAVRAAVALVSPVVCPDRCGPVEVILDEVRERPRICHAFADCALYLHPDGDAALDLAESVDVEISRHAELGIITDLNDDGLPVHAWGGAP